MKLTEQMGVVGVKCACCRAAVIVVNEAQFEADRAQGGAYYLCKACAGGYERGSTGLFVQTAPREDLEERLAAWWEIDRASGQTLDGSQLLIPPKVEEKPVAVESNLFFSDGLLQWIAGR